MRGELNDENQQIGVKVRHCVRCPFPPCKALHYAQPEYSAICHLQRKDVDFENRIIRVTKSASFSETGNQAVIKSTKTKAGEREALLLERLLVKPSVTPRQLRRAFATVRFEMGVSAKDAQRLLGHSEIDVTLDTYTHIRAKRRDDVAEKLNNAE